jgi:hypothetical protein
MPSLSGVVPNVRVAVTGAVGALIFIIPVAPGPGAPVGARHHQATAVQPPASTRVVQSTALFATACVADGSCTAGGSFGGAGRPLEPMVATQSHGRWSRSIPLLLPPNAAAQPYAQVGGLACRSAGNCVAVGDYQYGRSGSLQAFIAIESRGRWARAFTPRLPANAASPPSAQLEAVTCTSDGSCEAVGSYQDSAGNTQTMVLGKPPSGPWGQAAEIASPPDAAANPEALMTGIACNASGSCVAVGNYSVSASQFAAMGAVQVRGTWHQAAQIALPDGAIASTFTAITSVSCPTASQCLGVGQYAVSPTQSRAMTVIESQGRFGRAVPITAVPPGSSRLSSTYLLGVSCQPSGLCLAVGGGRNSSGHSVAMYMIRSAWRWQAAFLVPPPGATSGPRQLSVLYSVSCTGQFRCGAVGYYRDQFGATHAEAAATPLFHSGDGGDLGPDQPAVGDVEEPEGSARLPPPVGGRPWVEDPLAVLLVIHRDVRVAEHHQIGTGEPAV